MIKAVTSNAVAFHLGAYYPDEGPPIFNEAHFRGSTPARTRGKIYARMIYASYHEEQDKDIMLKLSKRGLTSTRVMVYYLHENYGRIDKRLPYLARYVQFALLFNALITDCRFRFVKAKDSYPCHFCGTEGEDDIRHIWTCRIVSAAWDRFGIGTGLRLTTESLGAQNDHHIQNLAFNGTEKSKEVNAIVIFNWAVWSQRQRYFKLLPTPIGASAAAVILADTAIQRYKKFVSDKKKKYKNQSKLDNYVLEMKNLVRLIQSIPSYEAVCYTDGSALGNPGPAGAGAILSFPSTDGARLVEGSVPLGIATNNIGELWGIAMAVQMVEREEASHNCKPVAMHIITDSMYGIGIIQGSAIRANVQLANRVKELVLSRRTRAEVHLHWVKGHLDVDGNEQADMLAKLAAKKSRTLDVDLVAKINANNYLY